MELECYSANEITKVVRATYNIRIFCRSSAAHSDSPTMGVLMRGMHLAFFGGEHYGSVSIYDRSVDRKALENNGIRKDLMLLRDMGDQTLTRTRSVDIWPASGRVTNLTRRRHRG